MRVVPDRPLGLQIATVLGGLVLGPLGAFRLNAALAPGSEVVETVAMFLFAAVFVGGTMLWMGLGVAAVVLGTVWGLLRGRLPGSSHAGAAELLVPPGYRAYVVLGVLLGGLVGVLAGILTPLRLVTATGVWSLAGLAYGLILWAAAHHGFLPFPEPE